MFVTSDTFDLKRIGRSRRLEWQENLLCGVVVHGTNWRGYQAAARYMMEAANSCGLAELIADAGYSRPGDRRAHVLAPKSFGRLARGELAGAKTATGVFYRGTQRRPGAESGTILFGGEATIVRHRKSGRPDGALIESDHRQAFMADFLFPLNDHPLETALELFRLSVDVLGPEYGYYFVRDSLCEPWLYPHGIGAGLDGGLLHDEETDEIGRWGDFYGEGQLWAEGAPKFRDLFEANLISSPHTSTPMQGLGYLHEWIADEPGRGTLKDLGEGRLLWTLTSAEIFAVRPVLERADLLFSCRERVYRDLPQGAADAQRMFDAQRVNWAPWVSDARRDYPGRFAD